jgi:hypothetical protein
MVHIEEGIIVPGHPCGELIIKPGNVALLRVLVPRLKRAKRIAAVNYIR